MKRTSIAVSAFALAACLAAGAAPATTILYSFTALPGKSDSCKWFDDNLNADRSPNALARQTDLLYNRIALPPGADVTVEGTATTAAGSPLVDFHLGGRGVCTSAEALYGPTPEPSSTPVQP